MIKDVTPDLAFLDSGFRRNDGTFFTGHHCNEGSLLANGETRRARRYAGQERMNDNAT